MPIYQLVELSNNFIPENLPEIKGIGYGYGNFLLNKTTPTVTFLSYRYVMRD